MEVELALVGDAEVGFVEAGERVLADFVVGVAEVDGKGRGLGNGVRGTGVNLDFPNGDNERRAGLGEGFCGEDAGGGTGEGVAAERHGSGARVVGAASEGDGQAGLTRDGGDDTRGFVGFFEDAALLDVKLDVAARGAGWVQNGCCGGGGTFCRDGSGDADTCGVLSGQRLRIKRRGDAATAEISGLKAGAFFIRKSEKVDGERKGDCLEFEGFERCEGGDDAEGAVVFPGVDDGVVV